MSDTDLPSVQSQVKQWLKPTSGTCTPYDNNSAKSYATLKTVFADHVEETRLSLSQQNEVRPYNKLDQLNLIAEVPSVVVGGAEGLQILKQGWKTILKKKGVQSLSSGEKQATNTVNPAYRPVSQAQLSPAQQLSYEALVQAKNTVYRENRAYFTNRTSHFTTLKEHTMDLDPRLGTQFDAHGLTKGGFGDQVNQLVNLLTEGVDKSHAFHTAPLSMAKENLAGAGAGLGTSGGAAYADGFFMVLSKPGQKIAESGIHTVLVDEQAASLIPHLQGLAPNVRFIPSSQAEVQLAKQLSQTQTPQGFTPKVLQSFEQKLKSAPPEAPPQTQPAAPPQTTPSETLPPAPPEINLVL